VPIKGDDLPSILAIALNNMVDFFFGSRTFNGKQGRSIRRWQGSTTGS